MIPYLSNRNDYSKCVFITNIPLLVLCSLCIFTSRFICIAFLVNLFHILILANISDCIEIWFKFSCHKGNRHEYVSRMIKKNCIDCIRYFIPTGNKKWKRIIYFIYSDLLVFSEENSMRTAEALNKGKPQRQDMAILLFCGIWQLRWISSVTSCHGWWHQPMDINFPFIITKWLFIARFLIAL